VPVTEAMTAFDPKQKYMTDRYQVVQSNDGTSGIPVTWHCAVGRL
jgi:hypothetical protein